MSKVLVKLSRSHSADDSIQRRDELIFARNHDGSLAFLELNRLCPVAHRQSDCPEHVLGARRQPGSFPLSALRMACRTSSLRLRSPQFYSQPQSVAELPDQCFPPRRLETASWVKRRCAKP